MAATRRTYNGTYRGASLNRIAFPMGGLGAGMVGLEGAGALSHLSLRNRPDVFNEPYCYAAICLRGQPNVARVVEGPVPAHKAFGAPGTANGAGNRTYGLPRFAAATFQARFPFAVVRLSDPRLPLRAEITGWSPFIPGNADDSSLPVAALEYRFTNASGQAVEAVFSFNSRHLVAAGQGGQSVGTTERGFVFRQAAAPERPWERGEVSVTADAPEVAVNAAWFRGGWFDPQTMAWNDVVSGQLINRPAVTDGGASPGASLFVPLHLEPGASRTVALRLAWYVPETDIRAGEDPKPAAAACACQPGAAGCAPTPPSPARYRPWYAARFADLESVTAYWRDHYSRLRRESQRFSRCLYDSTLPAEVLEAVAANLTILKSPTVLRQGDGRLWAWEGCFDGGGCCHGSCTHVWNYAQAIAHLFPDLERTLRQTEFGDSQDERGHQSFRASLPIRPPTHTFHAAADGQLGGIVKVFRDWRISGDSGWLRALWPQVRASLDYGIATWDPDHRGALFEPHHNTYDIEFWGPDGMCTSFYLAALQAAVLMGRALGEAVGTYEELLARGRAYMEGELYNGEYFIQKVTWQGLHARSPADDEHQRAHYSPEALDLLHREGPKYQYGTGCLSDGVLGAWLAAVSGVPGVLDAAKVSQHLAAVHRHNFRADLSEHANLQRPTFAFGREGGLLLCSWPRGGRLSLPFVYSDEVWTGIEYQVASHLLLAGLVEEGLQIVRACRDRYDGVTRNPFDEYECGHWYARALASYGLLQGLSGARYDAVDKVLYLAPSVRGDFRSFVCTATGYGTVGVREGQPFLEVRSGRIEVARIEYRPAP